MKATERAYMAGIIDGEGCVYVNKRKASGRRKTPGFGVKVCVSTTDECLVTWMREHAGLTSVHYVSNPGPNRKPKWLCTWNNSAAERLLTEILGYLVIKVPQAELGLELLKHLRTAKTKPGQPVPPELVEYRQSIKDQISNLNKRGLT